MKIVAHPGPYCRCAGPAAPTLTRLGRQRHRHAQAGSRRRGESHLRPAEGRSSAAGLALGLADIPPVPPPPARDGLRLDVDAFRLTPNTSETRKPVTTAVSTITLASSAEQILVSGKAARNCCSARHAGSSSLSPPADFDAFARIGFIPKTWIMHTISVSSACPLC